MFSMGNDRLYQAVLALCSGRGDVRSRVVDAMRIIDKMHPNELDNSLTLKSRLARLISETSKNPPQIVLGKVVRDRFEVTASAHQNKTYEKFAREIFEIWSQTNDTTPNIK